MELMQVEKKMIENKKRQSLPDIEKIRDSSLANGSEFNLTHFVDSRVDSREAAIGIFDQSPSKFVVSTTEDDTVTVQNTIITEGSTKHADEDETNLNSSVKIKEEIDRFSILDDQRQELERIIKKKKRKMHNQQIKQIVTESLAEQNAGKTTLKGKSWMAMVKKRRIQNCQDKNLSDE